MLSIAIGSFEQVLERGAQLDGFSSTEIVIEAVVAALAFYLFLVQTFTAKAPFIDPHIFKDRNFTIGLCFIFVVGIILLASLALITPYLQNLMGYPVLTAGLVLAPRGMGTMLAMMIVGRIINRVDARVLLAAGLLLTAELLWETTHFTPDVSHSTLVLAALDAEVTKQASVVAYADDFKLMMLVALVALPLIFLLRRAKAQPGEAAILE